MSRSRIAFAVLVLSSLLLSTGCIVVPAPYYPAHHWHRGY
jgi:hypothetical protein